MAKTPKERRKPYPAGWDEMSQTARESWVKAEDIRVDEEIRAEAAAKTLTPEKLEAAKASLAVKRPARFKAIAEARHGKSPLTEEERGAVLDQLYREDEVERFNARKAKGVRP